MNRNSIITGLAITFALVGLIWFGGWDIWTRFELWETMPETEYHTTLYVVIAVVVVMAGGLTMRYSKVPLQRQEVEHSLTVNDPPQGPVDLGPIHKRLDKITEKLADVHMVMKFLKNVEEKKPPIASIESKAIEQEKVETPES